MGLCNRSLVASRVLASGTKQNKTDPSDETKGDRTPIIDREYFVVSKKGERGRRSKAKSHSHALPRKKEPLMQTDRHRQTDRHSPKEL